MPQNRKQEAIFTLLMVGMMVLGMNVYNVILHSGVGPGFLVRVAAGALPAFLVALALTVAFVNRAARTLTRRLPIDKASRWQVTVATACFMMAMMVTLMSAYATAVNTGLNSQFWPAWGTAVAFNSLVALPLQLLVVGPASRLVLSAIQRRQKR
ncbi:MAG: DUF2798 domain-containing protein [Propionibacteriaceae bacterium]|jgi:hypothetical protein|nr:DUF2798 domain-containing protein [Propionibacteriaceae bacterium]